jgi:hypothetical protein
MKPAFLFAFFAAAALLTPVIARANDLSGTWTFQSAGPKGGSSTMTCKLTQSGTNISGPCVTPLGSTVDASGTVTGDRVDIGYNLTGSPLHVDFKGVVQPDGSLKGTVTVGIPPAPFTGIKQ